MIDKGIARHDHEIKDEAGNLIGKVTSGTQAPSLGKAIGMGYVDAAFVAQGTPIYISIRDKSLKAEIVKIPFA
jgi:aminomethyltransferase